jgi:hypothetical protein
MDYHYTLFTFESFFENTEDELHLEKDFQDVIDYLDQLTLEPRADIIENIVSFAAQQEEE